MFRLMGFLAGSFLSIATLVLLIGTPDFHLGGDDEDVARFDVAVEKLKAKQAPLQADPDALEPAPADSPAETPLEPAAVATAEPLRVAEPPASAPSSADSAIPPQAPTPDPEWHAFWTPFRTEIAARGFVRRLERVTGLDYQILKMNRGEYQVAFAYGSDDELDAKLSQIAAATGLDLSGNLP
jgi:hypothetical protein